MARSTYVRKSTERLPAPKNLIAFGVLLLLCTWPLLSQQDPMTSNWQQTKGLYNAGTVGSHEQLYITALYRQQWIGIQGAPANMTLFADAPLSFLGRKHGVGVAIVGQKKGLFVNTDFKAQYAFQLKLLGGSLAIAIEAGLFNSAFDGTKVFIPDGEGLNPSDPAIPTAQVSGRAFDTGAGIYFTHRRFYLGIAAKHLLQPRVPLGTNHYLRLVRSYNAMAGYNITPRNSLFSWHPSVLAVTDFNAYRIDIGLTVAFAERYFAGVMYRPNNAAGFSIGAKWGKIRIGYAFEMPISELARGNYGTHELVVSYSMPINPKKDKGLKQKSIRLL